MTYNRLKSNILSMSLQVVHDLALYYSDVSIDADEKRVLFSEVAVFL